MIFNMEHTIKKIRELHNALLILPYGHEIRGGEKTIPPSFNQYANYVDTLIDELISLYNMDSTLISLSEIEYIQSLRDNEVNQASVNSSLRIVRFNELGYDEELQRISNSIALITNRFL